MTKADESQMFGSHGQTIEDFMKDKGQLVKKGTLSQDGDVEYWEDKSTEEVNIENSTNKTEPKKET